MNAAPKGQDQVSHSGLSATLHLEPLLADTHQAAGRNPVKRSTRIARGRLRRPLPPEFGHHGVIKAQTAVSEQFSYPPWVSSHRFGRCPPRWP
jgi:hypothetical protein